MCRSDLKIFLRIEPDIPKLTHQHGIKPTCRGGKVFQYKTQELQNLEALYQSLLAPHAPESPWDCPILLRTTWNFRRPKSAKGLYKTTKPDTDNLIKTLKDCMKAAGYFKDDALVAVEQTAKVWANEDCEHGIEIRMIDLSAENG